jgi:hypothetical protein
MSDAFMLLHILLCDVVLLYFIMPVGVIQTSNLFLNSKSGFFFIKATEKGKGFSIHFYSLGPKPNLTLSPAQDSQLRPSLRVARAAHGLDMQRRGGLTAQIPGGPPKLDPIRTDFVSNRNHPLLILSQTFARLSQL